MGYLVCHRYKLLNFSDIPQYLLSVLLLISSSVYATNTYLRRDVILFNTFQILQID